MHKITKGIKKKIKSKKGNKGDDLFDPAELEKYRKEKEQREAAAAAAAAASEEGAEEGHSEAGEEPREGSEAEGNKEEDEEWQRFKALTAGVDSVLKKSQGDLDRIKSTSYFQRKKPGVQTNKDPVKAAQPQESASKGAVAAAAGVKPKRWVGFEEGSSVDEKPPEEEEIVVEAEAEKAEEEEEKPQEEEKVPEEEEEEEELEEEEDIFDTSYVDIVASGELKLAYIPESPIKEAPGEEGFDPFDTSIADKFVEHEPESQKGKKPRQLVSLGCAVEVLTGRIDKAQVVPSVTQTSKKRRVNPARRGDNVDLFFLDDEAELPESKETNPPGSGAQSRRASGAALDPFGALDENGIPDTTPIGEAINIIPPLKESEEKEEDIKKEEEEVVLKDLVNEFDTIGEVEPTPAEVEEELLFVTNKEPEANLEEEEDEEEDEFAALAAESAKKRTPVPSSLNFEEETQEEEDDPFDTSAAAGILGDLPVTQHKVPPARPPRIVSSPDVDVLLGGGKDEDLGWEEFEPEVCHPPLRPAPPSVGPPPRPAQPPVRPPPITFTTASEESFVPSLGQPPLTFTETAIEAITRDLDSKLEAVDVDDPFDTSFAEVVSAPGRAELRLIESEILGDVEDEIFDPRAGEGTSGVKEILSSVTIHISLPSGEEEAEQEIGGSNQDNEISEDLFDSTSGQEEEFVSSLQLSHRDLLGGSTTDLSKLGHDPISPDEAIDKNEEDEIEDYVDPFDTSIVDPKIAPGKAELKIIEKELLGETETEQTAQPIGLKRTLSDPDFDPRGEEDISRQSEIQQIPAAEVNRPDILEVEDKVFSEPQTLDSVLSPSARPDLLSVGEDTEVEFSKPLTPLVEEGERISEAILKTDGVDPFDTTFAENILPGKAELRIIENELFGGPDVTAGIGITRSLSDPDFDPRESSGGEQGQNQKLDSAANSRRRFSDVTALRGGIEQRSPRLVHPTTLPLQSIANPAAVPPSIPPSTVRQNQPDLLAVEEEPEAACKPLSPARKADEEEGDPFDTSTVSIEVLKPGKAELKILESELIGGEEQAVPVYQTNITAQVQALVLPQYQSAPPSNSNVIEQEIAEIKPPDLLNLPESEDVTTGPKPLTPLVENSDFPSEDDFDPFDTSIAEGLGPGRTELKLLESELIGQ